MTRVSPLFPSFSFYLFFKTLFSFLTSSLDSYQLFIYADICVPIEDSGFWQRGYQLRRKTTTDVQRSSNSGHVSFKGHSTGTLEDVLTGQKFSSRSSLEPGSPSYMPSSPEGNSNSNCKRFSRLPCSLQIYYGVRSINLLFYQDIDTLSGVWLCSAKNG